jgi:Calcineurin-like phosphoesterase
MAPEPARLMLTGDWHRNTRWALRMIEHADDNGVDTILQLGDFGFWPNDDGTDKYVAKLSKQLQQRGIRLYWLDGNHENHDAIDAGLADDRESVGYLPRGFRWRWWGKDWMAVGGGVSVDKTWRRPGIDWFDREVLSPDEFEHCCRPGNVDIIVSHDCPSGVRIPGFHAEEKQGITPNWFPPEAIAESEAHRALLAAICDSTEPAYLFHGHYHSSYCDELSTGTDLFGLDKDGTSIASNTLILTEADLP